SAVALHAALSLVLTLAWFVASVFSDLCEQIQGHMQPSPRQSDRTAEKQQAYSTQAAGLLMLPVSKESEVTPEMIEKLVSLTFDDQFGSRMIEPTKAAIDRL